MWTLVVFLFAASVPDPKMGLINNTKFATEEACMAHFDSEQGIKERASIEQAVKDASEELHVPMSAYFQCLPSGPKGDKI